MKQRIILIILSFSIINLTALSRNIDWYNLADQDFTNPANWLTTDDPPVVPDSILPDDNCQVIDTEYVDYPILSTDVTAARLMVGRTGYSARLDITAGNLAFNGIVYIGNGASGDILSHGTVNMTGGDMLINERLMVGNLDGIGEINLSGGTIETSEGNAVYFPHNRGVGILNMTSGSITSGSDFVVGGNGGAGEGYVTVSGGTINVANGLRMCLEPNGFAEFDVKGDAAINVDKYVTIGSAADANSIFTIGDNASLVADRVNVSFEGSEGSLVIKDNASVTTTGIDTTDNTGDLTVAENGEVSLIGSNIQVDLAGNINVNTGSKLNFVLNSDSLVTNLSCDGEAILEGEVSINITNSIELINTGSHDLILLTAGQIGTSVGGINISISGDHQKGEGALGVENIYITNNSDGTESLIATLFMQEGYTCQDLIDAGERIDGDINGDCFVDIKDFAIMATNWLNCNDPDNSNCI